MSTPQCTGEPQSAVSLRFVSLIKQYMEQQWAASDDSVNIQQASDQDACWDMSVLQACLADQQKAWTSSCPQPSSSQSCKDCAVEPMVFDAPAPQQPSAVELLNQVLDYIRAWSYPVCLHCAFLCGFAVHVQMLFW